MLAESAEFPHPFNESFAFGGDLSNRRHPGGEALLRFRAAVALSKIRKSLPAEQLGKLEDALSNFDKGKKAFHFNYDRFSSSMIRMFTLAQKFRLLDLGEISASIPDANEFIPGTITTFYDKNISFTNNNLDHIKNIKFFGKAL